MATSYYVDTASSGGDGTTTATSGAQAAYATVAAAQAALTGDQSDNSLLFKRGCIWRETFTPAMSGTAGHPFTIGKYGTTGADPIINGADVVTTWTSYGTSYADLTGDADLRAFWYFEDASGNALDETANNNDFVPTTTVLYHDTNHVQGSYSIDTNGTNYLKVAFANIAANFPLKVAGVDQALTYGFRMYYNATPTAWDVLWTFGDQWDYGFVFGLDGDKKPYAKVYTSAGGGANVQITGTTVIAAGQWYSLAMRRDAATNLLSLWVNGASEGTPAAIAEVGVCTADDMTLGNPADISVDEAWAFTRSLTDAEITGVHNVGLVGSTSTTYSTTLTTEPTQVFMDDTRLVKGTNKDALGNHTWIWASNVLYVNDTTGDPDVTGVAIEASVRANCITLNDKDYLSFSDITAEKASTMNIYIYGGCNNLIFDRVKSHRAFYYGLQGAGTGNQSTITVKNCEVSYCGGNGIALNDYSVNWLTQANNVHHNCTVLYPTDVGSVDGYHIYTAGIKITAGSTTGAIIEKNYVHHNGKGGVSGESMSGIWCDMMVPGAIIRYNRVASNDFDGIRMEAGSIDGKLYGNLCYLNGHDGIALQSGGDTYPITGSLVYNNTCYGNTNAGILVRGWIGYNGSCTGNLIKNNISSGNAIHELMCLDGGENDGTLGSGNVYLYNCLGAEASNFIEWGSGVHKSTYDAWETAYGGTTSSIEADPAFTNAAGDDFTLTAGSPCIDTGVDLGATYQNGLGPSSTWPDGVVLIDQETHAVI